ncbi:uncharacterized protein N7500_007475 [Penicillium coprophilum]|uniref:uncharacterized protein n=1 Tax=Penicillium coprophilum TaxID=36646 RepID=UPI0023938492|nr:uncharacterized protein N7500_007475 [Penicillium coprophilum]KAJ5165645.1 hypothetical protein N7500_007475 [Penicillium coprophilum]
MKYEAVPATDEGEEGKLSDYTPSEACPRHRYSTKLLATTLILIVLLVLSNVGWIWVAISRRSMSTYHHSNFPSIDMTHTAFYQDTPFNGEEKEKPHADELWKGLFPYSIQDPDAEDKVMYVLAGYHNLHCLTILRSAFFHYHVHGKEMSPWPHVVHCLDQIRQTLMCNFDMTFVPMTGPKEFKDGQEHVCKDYWQIHNWTSGYRSAYAPGDDDLHM